MGASAINHNQSKMSSHNNGTMIPIDEHFFRGLNSWNHQLVKVSLMTEQNLLFIVQYGIVTVKHTGK